MSSAEHATRPMCAWCKTQMDSRYKKVHGVGILCTSQCHNFCLHGPMNCRRRRQQGNTTTSILHQAPTRFHADMDSLVLKIQTETAMHPLSHMELDFWVWAQGNNVLQQGPEKVLECCIGHKLKNVFDQMPNKTILLSGNNSSNNNSIDFDLFQKVCQYIPPTKMMIKMIQPPPPPPPQSCDHHDTQEQMTRMRKGCTFAMLAVRDYLFHPKQQGQRFAYTLGHGSEPLDKEVSSLILNYMMVDGNHT
ncbi:unnamed protein product [Cylindrotheca closterium]|uniref:Uncharacterized protein n=1 Tax=Cylindrotheca closterium TaxID=2856 RepID=A0AAD2JM60_9STRA|nr:unnamed protein product [Cylindrotheca closterium]